MNITLNLLHYILFRNNNKMRITCINDLIKFLNASLIVTNSLVLLIFSKYYRRLFMLIY